tara:strand:- start:399 stop:971 length:573 start_codon:yes stop_codon:yes gene_type:complete
MANIKISDLTEISTINSATDYLIIEKSNGGGTFKISLDNLVANSNAVSSSTQLGAPVMKSANWKFNPIHSNPDPTAEKTIAQTNILSQGSSMSGTINFTSNRGYIQGGKSGTDGVATITKMAGHSNLLVGGVLVPINGVQTKVNIGQNKIYWAKNVRLVPNVLNITANTDSIKFEGRGGEYSVTLQCYIV